MSRLERSPESQLLPFERQTRGLLDLVAGFFRGSEPRTRAGRVAKPHELQRRRRVGNMTTAERRHKRKLQRTARRRQQAIARRR